MVRKMIVTLLGISGFFSFTHLYIEKEALACIYFVERSTLFDRNVDRLCFPLFDLK